MEELKLVRLLPGGKHIVATLLYPRNTPARYSPQKRLRLRLPGFPSERTILGCGGVFEKEVQVDGEWIKRYWITVA